MLQLTLSKKAWAFFTFFSISCAFTAWHYFPQAFPIIHLNITIDKAQALEKANTLIKQFELLPHDGEQIATFNLEDEAKTYIELEGGGKEAFVRLLNTTYFQPYQWKIRHFKEFDPHEASIFLSPEGKRYGFIQTLSTNDKGAALSSEKALTIAQQTVSAHWVDSFNDYSLIEQSNTTVDSGRRDHTFVFEHKDTSFNQARIRLKVIVSGDTVSAVLPFMHIPELFTKKYQEMRSLNTTITNVGWFIMVLLYIIGGALVSLFILGKKNLIAWKSSLMWGCFIAFLMLCSQLNSFSNLWFFYNTAVAKNHTIFSFSFIFIINFFMQLFGLTLIIATAESLTRVAFDNQPQFFRLWSTANAGTTPILQRTYIGYLMVGFYLLFITGFYLLTTRYLNWWVPSDTLFSPDILATTLPWLTPFTMALYAGFLEECLFRAIPIAGARIVGKRYGYEKSFLVITFIAQALIFGALHANYPTQPGFARLVELFIPSTIFGLLYYNFGLYSAILTHFTFDIILMSLPLFVSQAPYAWINQLIVIMLTAIPLIITAMARIRYGNTLLSNSQLNSNWIPEPSSPTTTSESFSPESKQLPLQSMITVPALIIGVTCWYLFVPLTSDGPTVTISREQAIVTAKNYITHQGIALDTPYQTLVAINEPSALEKMQHIFAWRTGGKTVYHDLLTTYLSPVRFIVRFARFDGSLEERSTEYQVTINSRGEVQRLFILLPEEQTGPSLSQEKARTLAQEKLQLIYALAPSEYNEIAAQEIARPNRKDWLFTFENKELSSLAEGKARINIYVAGDMVTDYVPFIYVPEQWSRDEANRTHSLSIISLICSFIYYALLLGALFVMRRRTAKPFSLSIFFTLTLCLLTLFVANGINCKDSLILTFNTSEPFNNQLFAVAASIFITILFKALALAGFITFLIGNRLFTPSAQPNKVFVMSLLMGIAIYGAGSFLHYFNPLLSPEWQHYFPLTGTSTLLTLIANQLSALLLLLLQISLLFGGILLCHTYWNKNSIKTVLLIALFGMTASGGNAMISLSFWILSGITYFLIYNALFFLLIRYDYKAIIPITYAKMIIVLIQQLMFNAYPGALIDYTLTIAILGIVAWKLFMLTNEGND